MMESVNFIKIKGPREARTYDKKFSLAAGIGKILKICLRTARGEGGYISVYLFHEKWSFFNQTGVPLDFIEFCYSSINVWYLNFK